MRRMKIGYESFIHFGPQFFPPGILEAKCVSHQLICLDVLQVPDAQGLVDMAHTLACLKASPSKPEESEGGSGDKADDIKDVTPKKTKGFSPDGDPEKKKQRTHSKHGSVSNPSTLSPDEVSTCFYSTRLGTSLAQACLSVVKMTQTIEHRHNVKMAEALLVKKNLETASAEAIESMMADIQVAHTLTDMWRIEKRLSAQISPQWAKAFEDLAKYYRAKPKHHEEGERGISEAWSLAGAEVSFHKLMMDLVSTVLAEGAKIPGGQGIAMTSNILQLVPSLPLNPVVVTCTDLLAEPKVVTWEPPRSSMLVPSTLSPLASSPLTRSMGARKSSIKFSQAVNAIVRPITHIPPAVDTSFFKKLFSIGAPQASSSPISRSPVKDLWDDLDMTASVNIGGDDDDDDDDVLFVPVKSRLPPSMVGGGGLKITSPLTKKACVETTVSKESRSRTVCSSHTLWAE